MEITQGNFWRLLPAIREAIDWCEFAAVDVEFTGLGLSRVSQLDTPARRYARAREDCEEYPPCQFGLALFGRAEGGQSCGGDGTESVGWEVVVLSVYLCARAVFGGGKGRYPVLDRVWKMQASSLEFLARSGLDFRKWLEQGVDWVRRGENEQRLRRVLDEDLGKLGPLKNFVVAEGEQEFVRELEKKLRRWWKGKEERLVLKEEEDKRKRKLLYGIVRENFPNVKIEKLDFGERCVCLEKCATVEDAQVSNENIREEERQQYIDRRVRNHIGFRHVIDALTDSQKPLIVHNCLLDLTKIIGNFIAPLPQGLSEFKKLVHSQFPTVVDTKYLVNFLASNVSWFASAIQSAGGSSLVDYYLQLVKQAQVPKISVSQVPLTPIRTSSADLSFVQYTDDQRVRDSSKDSRNAHQAGYDAYVTGRLFLQLAGIINGGEPGFSTVAMAALVNRVAMSNCGGFTHMELREGVPDKNIFLNRDDVLVVEGIKPEKEGARLDARWYEKITKMLLERTKYKANRKTVGKGRILLDLFLQTGKEEPPKRALEPPRKLETNGEVLTLKDSVKETALTQTSYSRTRIEDPKVGPEQGTSSHLSNGEHSILTKSQEPYRRFLNVDRNLAIVYANAAALGLKVQTYREALEAAEEEDTYQNGRKRRKLI